MEDVITLDYGSGGQKTAELIDSLLVPAFSNPALNDLGTAPSWKETGSWFFPRTASSSPPGSFPAETSAVSASAARSMICAWPEACPNI